MIRAAHEIETERRLVLLAAHRRGAGRNGGPDSSSPMHRCAGLLHLRFSAVRTRRKTRSGKRPARSAAGDQA
jgi:hypothetical protein